jgi:hypothetical protein
MGWDLHFFRRAPGTEAQDMENWLPLGARDEVSATLTAILGAPSPRVAGYWVAKRDGCEFRVSVGDGDDPVSRVSVGVYGGGDPFPTMRTIAAALSCEVLELVNLDVVDLRTGRSEGLATQREVEASFGALRQAVVNFLSADAESENPTIITLTKN